MKICLPVEQLNGLDSAIAPSFRAATKLLLVDSSTLECLNIDASEGSCGAVPMPIDAIIFAEGMGRGMFNGLKQNGIRVFSSAASTVREALVALVAGHLQEVHAVACCGGDADSESHAHAHQGCGCSSHGAEAQQGQSASGCGCGHH